MLRIHRLKKELQQLSESSEDGIWCYPKTDKLDLLTGTITGPSNTPYEDGVFQLEIHIPERYPFEPPRITFKTPIYHPNIDNAGRICLDLLKMPPAGGWNPTFCLKNILDAIKLLLASPNPDDPMMSDIAEEYRYNTAEFERKVRTMVKKNKSEMS